MFLIDIEHEVEKIEYEVEKIFGKAYVAFILILYHFYYLTHKSYQIHYKDPSNNPTCFITLNSWDHS